MAEVSSELKLSVWPSPVLNLGMSKCLVVNVTLNSQEKKVWEVIHSLYMKVLIISVINVNLKQNHFNFLFLHKFLLERKITYYAKLFAVCIAALSQMAKNCTIILLM